MLIIWLSKGEGLFQQPHIKVVIKINLQIKEIQKFIQVKKEELKEIFLIEDILHNNKHNIKNLMITFQDGKDHMITLMIKLLLIIKKLHRFFDFYIFSYLFSNFSII